MNWVNGTGNDKMRFISFKSINHFNGDSCNTHFCVAAFASAFRSVGLSSVLKLKSKASTRLWYILVVSWKIKFRESVACATFRLKHVHMNYKRIANIPFLLEHLKLGILSINIVVINFFSNEIEKKKNQKD